MRPAIALKEKEVEALKQLFKNNKVVIVCDLRKVRSSHLQTLRRKIRNVHFYVGKNTIIRRAIDSLSKERRGLSSLLDYVSDQNLLLFTNENPFKIASEIRKSTIKAAAKAGDVATEDVVVHAGGTGLPAGPVMSELSEVGLPTKIEVGSVVIVKDTVVVREGERISAKLASVLSKLGIKPIELGISFKAAYFDGLLVNADLLQLDEKRVREDVALAAARAYDLSVSAAYPSPESVEGLLRRAVEKSFTLSLQTLYPNTCTVGEILKRGAWNAVALTTIVEKRNKEGGD